MAEGYRTVAERARASHEVQGSRFLGYVAPIEGPAEAEALLAECRETHPDATHHVPAYRVRTGPDRDLLREYEDDDGEPGGSAGAPALSVLRNRDLVNVAAVVVRYYGGTNLGVGGLARSYSRAVGEAVDAAGVATRQPTRTIAVSVGYDDSGTVRGLLESEGFEFEADYAETVAFAVTVPVDRTAELTDRLLSATSGRADIVEESMEGSPGRGCR